MASLVAQVYLVYLASYNNRATIGQRFDYQLTTALPKLKVQPDIERRVSQSLAQLVSVQPQSGANQPLQTNLRYIVPRRYRKILFTIAQYRSSGFNVKRLTIETAQAISSRIPIIAYISEPTANQYAIRLGGLASKLLLAGIRRAEASIGVPTALARVFHISQSLRTRSRQPSQDSERVRFVEMCKHNILCMHNYLCMHNRMCKHN